MVVQACLSHLLDEYIYLSNTRGASLLHNDHPLATWGHSSHLKAMAAVHRGVNYAIDGSGSQDEHFTIALRKERGRTAAVIRPLQTPFLSGSEPFEPPDEDERGTQPAARRIRAQNNCMFDCPARAVKVLISMSKAFTTGGCPSRGLKAHIGLGKTPQSHVLSARHAQATRQGRGHCCIQARAVPVGMGVWATKAGMTSIFTPEGLCLPATVLALEEGNIVTQVPSRARWNILTALLGVSTPLLS